MSNISNGNYDTDDGQHLSGLLTEINSNRLKKIRTSAKLPNLSDVVIEPVILGNHETNTLYYIAGNIIQKMIKFGNKVICDDCSTVIVGTYIDKPYTKLAAKRQIIFPSMVWPTETVYEYFKEMEIIFRSLYPVIKKQKNQIKILIDFYIKNLVQYQFDTTCQHNMKKQIMERFVKFKLKTVDGLRKKNRGINYSSRTMN